MFTAAQPDWGGTLVSVGVVTVGPSEVGWAVSATHFAKGGCHGLACWWRGDGMVVMGVVDMRGGGLSKIWTWPPARGHGCISPARPSSHSPTPWTSQSTFCTFLKQPVPHMGRLVLTVRDRSSRSGTGMGAVLVDWDVHGLFDRLPPIPPPTPTSSAPAFLRDLKM